MREPSKETDDTFQRLMNALHPAYVAAIEREIDLKTKPIDIVDAMSSCSINMLNNTFQACATLDGFEMQDTMKDDLCRYVAVTLRKMLDDTLYDRSPTPSSDTRH